MTRLDDDLAAYLAAATQAERQAALTQWLIDATDTINQAGVRFAQNADKFSQIADRFAQIADVLRNLKRLERRALSRGFIWNPQRLKQLSDEDLTG